MPGLAFAQLLLDGKGHIPNVIQLPNINGFYTGLIIFALVQGAAIIDILHPLFESCQLKFLQLFPGSRLYLLFPVCQLLHLFDTHL